MKIRAQIRVSWLLLVFIVMAWSGEARVKLNSIRTVILRESHVQAFNRSIGGREDMVYPCISDLECSEGSYCHASSRRNPAPPRCLTCRRKKRRCHRDGMCCSGNHCSNNMCVPVMVSHSIQDLGWKRRQTGTLKKPASKGAPGSPCVRSADCSSGLCCARHFWSRVCKPVLQLGQVCTRQRRKLHHSLELFQRCDCGAGLSCRPLARHAQQNTGHAQQNTGHAQKNTGHAQQITGHSQQITGHSQQITGHAQQITGHTQKNTGHAQQKRGHAQQKTGHAQQYTGHAQPITGHAQQLKGHAHQITGHAQKLTGHAQQITGHAHHSSSSLPSPTKARLHVCQRE